MVQTYVRDEKLMELNRRWKVWLGCERLSTMKMWREFFTRDVKFIYKRYNALTFYSVWLPCVSGLETSELVWFEMVEVLEFISKLNACGFTAQ